MYIGMKPHSKYLLGLDSFVQHYFLLESFTLLRVGVVSSFLLPDHIPLYEWFVAGANNELLLCFLLGASSSLRISGLQVLLPVRCGHGFWPGS